MREVTLIGLPLFVGLHEHRGGEAEQGGFVGELGRHTGAAFDFAVEPFEAVVGPQSAAMLDGEVEHRQHLPVPPGAEFVAVGSAAAVGCGAAAARSENLARTQLAI